MRRITPKLGLGPHRARPVAELPFGGNPFQQPRDPSGAKLPPLDHVHAHQDMRGRSEWVQLTTVDTQDYLWGQVIVVCRANLPAGLDNLEQPHVEVRFDTVVGGIASTVMEAATVQRVDASEAVSTGPLVLTLVREEMPDQLAVYARARRGGVAELATMVAADETLQLTLVGRFRR
jgi:hypothetical protein